MSTVTISLEIPVELAEQLDPIRDRLPEIIELGLLQWQDTTLHPLTPRQRVEQIWADAGLIATPDPTTIQNQATNYERQPPIQAGGKPASEIIIEQRGTL